MYHVRTANTAAAAAAAAAAHGRGRTFYYYYFGRDGVEEEEETNNTRTIWILFVFINQHHPAGRSINGRRYSNRDRLA